MSDIAWGILLGALFLAAIYFTFKWALGSLAKR